MKKIDPEELSARYSECLRKLAAFRSISHGSVMDREHGPGGPRYQWTRKEKAKTVSVALSREQYLAMKEATANWKECKKILAEMERISRKIIFGTLPDTARRTPLSDEVLGLS